MPRRPSVITVSIDMAVHPIGAHAVALARKEGHQLRFALSRTGSIVHGARPTRDRRRRLIDVATRRTSARVAPRTARAWRAGFRDLLALVPLLSFFCETRALIAVAYNNCGLESIELPVCMFARPLGPFETRATIHACIMHA